jgi:hypothetical protein
MYFVTDSRDTAVVNVHGVVIEHVVPVPAGAGAA